MATGSSLSDSKIFFLTEGGRSIGYGHITRCNAIYEAFEDRGMSPQLIINGVQINEDLLRGKRYEFFDWFRYKEKIVNILENSNIVFIDSYLADRNLYVNISNIAKAAVYFDDDLRIDYPKGFVLNGAILAEQLNYPAKEDVTYLLGASYFPLRRDFCDVSANKIHKEVEVLTVTCGGSDMHNVTPVILSLLNETYPDLQKKIVITSLFSNISEIKNLQDKNTELLCDLKAIDFRAVMQNSDIAISTGGQTLYELASVGLPAIAVCVAGNQSQNVSGWNKTGCMEYAGRYDDKDFLINLSTALDKMMSYEKRLSHSKQARGLVDGKGPGRICSFLLEGQ